MGSKSKIAELGSGTLEIDALTGQCLFEGKSLADLPIAKEIQLWLHDDLAANRIPIEMLVRAQLTARLSLSVIRWEERANKTQIFFAGKGALRPEKMHRCSIGCASEIATDEAVYRSTYQDQEEWPPGWPEA